MTRSPAARATMAMLATSWLAASCLLSACGGQGRTFAGEVCGATQRWADDSVTAVNLFQEASPHLDGPTERRARYRRAFAELFRVVNRFEDRVEDLPSPPAHRAEVADRLHAAVAKVRAEYADDLAEADALPDRAFLQVQITDGHLFTGTEKAKALVFDTIGSLWRDFDLVEPTCGRHEPVTVDDVAG